MASQRQLVQNKSRIAFRQHGRGRTATSVRAVMVAYLSAFDSPASASARARQSACMQAPPHTMSNIELWNGKKRLQTQVLDIAEDTVCIRSLDRDRDRFDIEFALEIGTTYNSFLIFGADKTALVDNSHEKFSSLYLKTLTQQLDKAGRKIDYIMASHTEPDHSGLTGALVDMFPDAVVVGSKVAINFLKGLMNKEFQSQAVAGGDKIDLGGGHVIEFVMAPNLHWPDTMFSFDHATSVMYTCDAFGCHYCTDDPWDTDVKAIMPHYRFYFDCLMKPNARSVTTALRKVKDLPFTTVATGHGPLLRFNMQELVDNYGTWAAKVGKAPASVAVLYSENYGFCDRLSQTIAKGITKANVATDMVDLGSMDHAELRAIVGKSAGVVIMCPDRANADVQSALSVAFTELDAKKHKALVAESYGGNDEPVDVIVSTLVDLGIPAETLRVKQTPTEQVYQQYEEAGTDLAQLLGPKGTLSQQSQAMDASVAKALGKLSSGLYVVTAAQNNAKGAMIASWVAQASFEPLGLTVAVAKDRAIESLMQVGDVFVLNALGDGKNKTSLMKHFLKRFPPGADRFEGVNTYVAANGSPVLADSIAHLELKVKSRMETSDHWITYCEVADGNVTTPDAKTAVHRRKVASYY